MYMQVDPSISTFRPLDQVTGSRIKYTGNGFIPCRGSDRLSFMFGGFKMISLSKASACKIAALISIEDSLKSLFAVTTIRNLKLFLSTVGLSDYLLFFS